MTLRSKTTQISTEHNPDIDEQLNKILTDNQITRNKLVNIFPMGGTILVVWDDGN